MIRAVRYFGQYLKIERNVSPHTLRNYLSDLSQFSSFLESARYDQGVDKIDLITPVSYTHLTLPTTPYV